MNLLILTRYDRLGASSRLRIMQYLPYLKAAGITVRIDPFFESAYLERLYAKQSTTTAAFRAYRHRLWQMLHRHRPDAIWLEKELFPWLPWAIERLFLPHGVPVISDYDDAIFHNYDLHRMTLVQKIFGQKIDHLMGTSAVVLAGNAYLADRALKSGAAEVRIVPTVVDTEVYDAAAHAPQDRKLRIGWIGTPSTWTQYGAPMMPMLGSLAAEMDAKIVAVGAGSAAHPEAVLEIWPWSEDREVVDVRALDIGIMPLDDTPWSRGKCGYKLIQYMACGLPVVASPVGVNTDIVEHGVNGFLASNETEWRQALSTLLQDSDLRRRMGAAGRRKVETQYSLQVWGPRVARMLADVAEGPRG